MHNSEARERVLHAAERLFVERGYSAVTVKDIAKAAGLHHATLYHHIPAGGKEQLYVEVTTRSLERHRTGIVSAIERAVPDERGILRAQMRQIAGWLIAQQPMDFVRMVHSDLPAIEPTAAQQIKDLAYAALFEPMMAMLADAEARSEITFHNPGNVAGAFFSAIQGLHTIPEEYVPEGRLGLADEIIDIFLHGIARG